MHSVNNYVFCLYILLDIFKICITYQNSVKYFLLIDKNKNCLTKDFNHNQTKTQAVIIEKFIHNYNICSTVYKTLHLYY